MPDNEELYPIDDFSGGTNRRVSTFQNRKNELFHSLNVTFTTVIGGISKRLGILQKGSDLTSTTSTSTSTSTTTTSTSTTTTLTTTTSTSTTTTSTSTTTTSTTTTSSSTSTTTTSSSTSSTSTSTTTTLPPSITYFDSASNPADNGTYADGTVPLPITPPASMVSGDLVVVITQSGDVDSTLNVSNAGGQTWNGLNILNHPGNTRRIFWCRFNGTWSADPSFVANIADPMTGVMHVFRPRDGANTWAMDVNQQNSNGLNDDTTMTITGITTIAANTVTIAFWSDPKTHTWTNLTAGWTTPGSVQYRNTSGVGMSNTAAYLIKTSAGTTGDVSKDRSAAEATAVSQAIMAFKDVTP